MLKQTKVYVAALAAVSAISLIAPSAFAQVEMEEDIVLFVAEPGDGPDMADFPPPGPPDGPPGEEAGPMAFSFSMPLPPPDVGAMRGGSRGMRMKSFGRGGCGMMMGRGGGCPLWMLDGENALTDEQYEKMYDLKNRTFDQLGPKMLELMTAGRHLRDALTQENIDDKAVKKLQSQISAAKADIESIKLNSKIEMMQSLTPAQRKELRQAMMKGPRAKMHKRWSEKRKES